MPTFIVVYNGADGYQKSTHVTADSVSWDVDMANFWVDRDHQVIKLAVRNWVSIQRLGDRGADAPIADRTGLAQSQTPATDRVQTTPAHPETAVKARPRMTREELAALPALAPEQPDAGDAAQTS